MTPQVESPAELDQFVIVRLRGRARRYVVGRVVEITREGAVREYARLTDGQRHHKMDWAKDKLWTAAPVWQPALASFWNRGQTGWKDLPSMRRDVCRRQAELNGANPP